MNKFLSSCFAITARDGYKWDFKLPAVMLCQVLQGLKYIIYQNNPVIFCKQLFIGNNKGCTPGQSFFRKFVPIEVWTLKCKKQVSLL